MPIETTCPNCQKQYKLKDELGGKSVKCSNPDCRHVFNLPPAAANGKPVKKTRKQAEEEAEALAAKLFSEAADDGPAEKTVAVECFACNHKWTEPESKAGKNVICPECKTRLKVPELKVVKKADWRDASGGRRLLEKGPDLPDDLAAQQMQEVSITALKDAGAIEAPEVEARPLKDYVLFGTAVVVALGLIAGGVFLFMKSGRQGQEDAFMAEAVKDIEELKDASHPVPEADRRLMRAALHIAHGEYQARLNTPQGMKEAVKAFAAARRELEAAPRSQLDRDALFAELAVAQLSLGGTEEQANSEVRLRWSPQGVKAPPVGSTPTDYVQAELRQTLTRMLEKEVDRGVRMATVVRLTRELCKHGRPEVLFEIVTQGFGPDDGLEAQTLLLLAASRAGTADDKLKPLAEPIRDQLKADPKLGLPWPAVALFDKLGLADPELKTRIPPPVEGSPVPAVTRLAYSALALTQGDTEKAVKLATAQPGTVAERLPAMTVLAELSDDPKPVLTEAAAAAKDAGTGGRIYLLRLARVAADAGAGDAAEAFARGITDDALREWALAEAARSKWAAGKAAGEVALPGEAGKAHVGHAWAALRFARHNAKTSGDPAATKGYDDWADKKLRGFGYAGLALGLQDGK